MRDRESSGRRGEHEVDEPEHAAVALHVLGQAQVEVLPDGGRVGSIRICPEPLLETAARARLELVPLALIGRGQAEHVPSRLPDMIDNLVEWAWAINAASSVLGSVLAMTVAIQFGLLVTLEGAAMAYVLAIVLLPRLRRA